MTVLILRTQPDLSYILIRFCFRRWRAESLKRPGLLRFMNALRPRPTFDMLITSRSTSKGRISDIGECGPLV